MRNRLVKWLDYAVARIRARRTSKNYLGSHSVHNILVVCYGNIYRSPFVDACLRGLSAEFGRSLDVRSAGFYNKEGRQVDGGFQEHVRSSYGIDLSQHRSRRLTQADLQWADLVLIMDGHNYRIMHHDYPDYLQKCIWLGAIATETPVIISDPYKKAQGVQQRVSRELYLACRALMDRIRVAGGGNSN